MTFSKPGALYYLHLRFFPQNIDNDPVKALSNRQFMKINSPERREEKTSRHSVLAIVINRFLFTDVQTLRSSNHTIAHDEMNIILWSRLYLKLFNDALTMFRDTRKSGFHAKLPKSGDDAEN